MSKLDEKKLKELAEKTEANLRWGHIVSGKVDTLDIAEKVSEKGSDKDLKELVALLKEQNKKKQITAKKDNKKSDEKKTEGENTGA